MKSLNIPAITSYRGIATLGLGGWALEFGLALAMFANKPALEPIVRGIAPYVWALLTHGNAHQYRASDYTFLAALMVLISFTWLFTCIFGLITKRSLDRKVDRYLRSQLQYDTSQRTTFDHGRDVSRAMANFVKPLGDAADLGEAGGVCSGMKSRYQKWRRDRF